MHINIKNTQGISITLRDSYLMLTQSLMSLSKTFNCSRTKLTEPVLVSKNLN